MNYLGDHYQKCVDQVIANHNRVKSIMDTVLAEIQNRWGILRTACNLGMCDLNELNYHMQKYTAIKKQFKAELINLKKALFGTKEILIDYNDEQREIQSARMELDSSPHQAKIWCVYGPLKGTYQTLPYRQSFEPGFCTLCGMRPQPIGDNSLGPLYVLNLKPNYLSHTMCIPPKVVSTFASSQGSAIGFMHDAMTKVCEVCGLNGASYQCSAKDQKCQKHYHFGCFLDQPNPILQSKPLEFFCSVPHQASVNQLQTRTASFAVPDVTDCLGIESYSELNQFDRVRKIRSKHIIEDADSFCDSQKSKVPQRSQDMRAVNQFITKLMLEGVKK